MMLAGMGTAATSSAAQVEPPYPSGYAQICRTPSPRMRQLDPRTSKVFLCDIPT